MKLLGAILYIAPLVWLWHEAKNNEYRDGFLTILLGLTLYYGLAGYLYWGRG